MVKHQLNDLKNAFDFFFDSTSGMGITAFYGASMEDEDAVKLLQAAYDMGYRCHGINKKEPEVARDGMRNLTDLSI